MVGWLGQKRILSKAPGWRNSIDAGSNPSFSIRWQKKNPSRSICEANIEISGNIRRLKSKGQSY